MIMEKQKPDFDFHSFICIHGHCALRTVLGNSNQRTAGLYKPRVREGTGRIRVLSLQPPVTETNRRPWSEYRYREVPEMWL